jgi:uncharacterized protein (DUF924 family)
MTAAHDFAPVLCFWFEEARPAQWWSADPAFDQTVRERFGAMHRAAIRGELSDWRAQPHGRLAEVIVLDQFSRNMHRGTALAFAADPVALVLAQEAVAGAHDHALAPDRRAFLYMPFTHSESARVHESSLRLFQVPGLKSSLDSELRHKAIVDRFGRYPHRNAILGRASTDEELEFLKQPGSSF